MTMGGRMKLWFILIIALMALPGVLSAQPAAAESGLQPGDKVTITVWQRDELSGDFTVAPDGSLNHPLYREVRVTGVPATQIEERLRSFLSAYEANPQVVVQPYYKVAIAGSVMRPDIYDLAPGTTVAQAVTRAGGVTENGKRDDVRLYRGGDESRLDITELEAVNMLVQSGDQILVRDKSSSGAFRTLVLPMLQIGFSIANILIYR